MDDGCFKLVKLTLIILSTLSCRSLAVPRSKYDTLRTVDQQSDDDRLLNISKTLSTKDASKDVVSEHSSVRMIPSDDDGYLAQRNRNRHPKPGSDTEQEWDNNGLSSLHPSTTLLITSNVDPHDGSTLALSDNQDIWTTPSSGLGKNFAVASWPNIEPSDNLVIGQVAGIAVNSKGNIVVFHRGTRSWSPTASSFFGVDNVYLLSKEEPIHENTLVEFDGSSGRVVYQTGSNMVFIPHGVTVDSLDNIWVTDLALHQVIKLQANSSKPTLTLGIEFEPGSDSQHFCKPTDVAVLVTGDIFVADGYCNNRIVKFSADGKFLMHWGAHSQNVLSNHYPSPSTFDLPVSLAYDKLRDGLCVADSRNRRVQCFDVNGHFVRQLTTDWFKSALCGLTFGQSSGYLYVTSAASSTSVMRVTAFDLSKTTGQLVDTWTPNNLLNTTTGYDIAVSSDGRYLYISSSESPHLFKFGIDTANNSHQSVKKGGVNLPHTSVDDGVDQSAGDRDSNRHQNILGASLVVGTLIVLPILIAVIVMIYSQLRKQGKFGFGDDRGHIRRLKLGKLMSRGRQGVNFHNLNAMNYDYGDELDPLRSDESEVEEFSSTGVSQRSA